MDTADTKTIFISGLPDEVDETQIRKRFSRFGRIVEINLIHSQGLVVYVRA